MCLVRGRVPAGPGGILQPKREIHVSWNMLFPRVNVGGSIPPPRTIFSFERVYMNDNPIDLFGNAIASQEDSVETGLRRRDKATIEDRVERWRFLEELRQGGEIHYLGDIEGSYLFRESEMAYVDGHFAATILLVLAIVERMLQSWLYDNGYSEESKKGIGRTIGFLRRHNLLHTFILDEIDKLRRKRNHFAHFKTNDEEMRVDMRIVTTKIYDPHALMQKDAEFSLRLLHHLYGTQLGKINISS